MSRSRSWKDNTKAREARRYGNRNTTKYDTPFMFLDTQYLADEGEEDNE